MNRNHDKVLDDFVRRDLPEEAWEHCLQSLAPYGSHAAVTAVSHMFMDVSRRDCIWEEHLARDFPLALRARSAGKLYQVYRMLAKAQPRALRKQITGTIFARRESVVLEIHNLATRFAYINHGVDLDAHIRTSPVVILPRQPSAVGSRANLLADIRARASID